MRFSILVLPLVLLMINIDDAESVNTTQRYFITIDIGNARVNGQYGVDNRRSLNLIENTLCETRPPRNSENPVTCFLKFKIVGEPRVFVVVDVLDSMELERRLRSLIRSSTFRYESEPLIDYVKFATEILGIDPTLAVLEGNTLRNIPEALWCEFNINFGDKNATEILSIWKQEAEVVFQARKSGTPTEVFKTLGERTVHLMVEMDATAFDQLLFGTPFNQQIPNTLSTTCKTIVSFDKVLRP
ncbi:uncharacterized protein LOC123553316 [Mercenaria mercenaria]|uniref:uncharacterized protein LOC123553316 n=1 Tax=Mercenaria mercenaria TaxID=6596 RepID=UPI00234F2675|nr:uncharacterized protein LOC123553316 [Mercenaria mercenaria]